MYATITMLKVAHCHHLGEDIRTWSQRKHYTQELVYGLSPPEPRILDFLLFEWDGKVCIAAVDRGEEVSVPHLVTNLVVVMWNF